MTMDGADGARMRRCGVRDDPGDMRAMIRCAGVEAMKFVGVGICDLPYSKLPGAVVVGVEDGDSRRSGRGEQIAK